MPIFEYVCKDCGKNFEAIVYGSKEAVCPGCSGSRLEQQLSRFAVGAEKAASFSSGKGACGSCGDPRGPGACSMDN
jgi:putative FmdB family regulatory protein